MTAVALRRFGYDAKSDVLHCPVEKSEDCRARALSTAAPATPQRAAAHATRCFKVAELGRGCRGFAIGGCYRR